VPLPPWLPASPVTLRQAQGAAVRHIFYLHGFASSPKSTKVGYFTARLREHALELRCPDFNEPDFATMTLTRMLEALSSELATLDGPATLVGSSLGGTLAILAASRFPARVDRLVLLAPAVMFAKPGHHLLPPERIEEWRRRGALPFFHYAYETERDLQFEFYEDSLRYDAFDADFDQPALIFQGLRDASVDHRTVEAFAKTRPNVTLSLLDDDHQLIASLPRIWNDVAPFFGLTE
jgi:pimeloyl-ACP methyl ester carboxylesterase